MDPQPTNEPSDNVVNSENKHFLVFEICSGSAKFSACCNEGSIAAIPFDHSRNTHNAWHPTVTLDLSDDDQCKILLEAVTSCQVKVILAALPCGACSKARDIPMGKHWHGPAPLRSSQHPRGLPGLSGLDLLKVTKANKVYDNVFVLLMAALQHNVGVIVENPQNS